MIQIGLLIFFISFIAYFFGDKIVRSIFRKSAPCPLCNSVSKNLTDTKELSREFQHTTKSLKADKRYSKNNKTTVEIELTFVCENVKCESFEKEFSTIVKDEFTNTTSANSWYGFLLLFGIVRDKKLDESIEAMNTSYKDFKNALKRDSEKRIIKYENEIFDLEDKINRHRKKYSGKEIPEKTNLRIIKWSEKIDILKKRIESDKETLQN